MCVSAPTPHHPTPHHPGTAEARRILELEGRDLRFCEKCGTGKGSMHVHHKDKNPYNNRLENLSVLCQHCHNGEHGREDSDSPLSEVAVETLPEQPFPLAKTNDQPVRIAVKLAVFRCRACNKLTQVQQTETEIREPSGCAHCNGGVGFDLLPNLSQFEDVMVE